jgi:hypothetical protein
VIIGNENFYRHRTNKSLNSLTDNLVGLQSRSVGLINPRRKSRSFGTVNPGISKRKNRMFPIVSSGKL